MSNPLHPGIYNIVGPLLLIIVSTVVESTICLDILAELTLAHPLIKNISKPIRYLILIFLSSKIIKYYYIVGPLPFLKSTLPPSASIRLITSSNKIGAKSVCSTQNG